MNLTKEDLSAKMQEKDAQRMASIKEFEANGTEIATLSNRVQELQRRNAELEKESHQFRVEVEQLAALQKMIEK